MQEITLKNEKKWQYSLCSTMTYDIYQTYNYHKLFTEQANCILLFFTKDKYKVYFPLLIRNIENSTYKDAISVYGYAGLVTNQYPLPLEIKSFFKAELHAYFRKNNIISAFSRLHPLMKTSSDFPDEIGSIENVNQTVYVDLRLPEKEQIAQYSASLRRQLKNGYESGIKIRVACKTEWPKFASLYYKTMDRLHAADSYYFSNNYFENFVNATNFESIILFAEYKNEIIGGGLFTCCNEFMQYHLGAVPEEFLYLSPLKALIDTARQIGNANKLKYLHLGGGYGGSDDDGLFAFKSRFSKQRAMFKVWKWIADEAAYTDLVLRKFDGLIPDNRFFPLYRLEK